LGMAAGVAGMHVNRPVWCVVCMAGEAQVNQRWWLEPEPCQSRGQCRLYGGGGCLETERKHPAMP